MFALLLDTALNAVENAVLRDEDLQHASAQLAARLNAYAQSLGKEPVAYDFYSSNFYSSSSVTIHISDKTVSCAVRDDQIVWSLSTKASTKSEVKRYLEQYFRQASPAKISTPAALLISRIRAEGIPGSQPEETIFFGAVSLHLTEHDDTEIYIDLLYVDPRYRKSQLGTKTLQLLTAWADYYCCSLVLESQPLTRLNLLPFLEGEEDIISSPIAQSKLDAFYKKFGFSGSSIYMRRKPRCKTRTALRRSLRKVVQAMPLGFTPSNEEFSTKLHGWFSIVEAAGDVTECDTDPVHVAVVYAESGYGPHTASLYIDQNRFHASPDTALQEAYEMHEAWMKEHYDDHLKELEEERLAEHVKDYLSSNPGASNEEAIEAVEDAAYQEAGEWFRETMDGMTWTMTAAEFVEAYDSWSAEDQDRVMAGGGVTITRREECEEPPDDVVDDDHRYLEPHLSSNKLLPKISSDKAYEISKAIRLRLTGTGLSEDEIEKAVKDALAEYDVVRPPRLSSTRQRRAGNDTAFDYILQDSEVLAVYEALEEMDDKGLAEMFHKVVRELRKRMAIDQDTWEGLSRIMGVVKSIKSWPPDLIRNNLGKALNSLGLKTPVSF